MIQAELKDLRKRFGYTLAQCGAVLGISAEGYRLKEENQSPLSGQELALLADLFGVPFRRAFPSYRPSPAEQSLARHLNASAA